MANKKIEAKVTDTVKESVPEEAMPAQPGSKDEEIERLRKKNENLETEARNRRGMLKIQDLEGPKEEEIQPFDERVERFIRRHIAKNGGFRRGTTEANKALTRQWLKAAGRDARKVKWDLTILDEHNRPVKKE